MIGGGPINHWNNSTIGNYWSDYNGTDRNNDGIGDDPYVINSLNIDNFPVMKQMTFELPDKSPTLSESPTTASISPNESSAPSPSIPELPTWILLPIALIVATTTVTSLVVVRKNRRK